MKKTFFLLFISSFVNAGLLDIFQCGVKGNPDRYASVELAATYNHQTGIGQVPDLGPFGANQFMQYNDRGMRGLLSIPTSRDTTLLLGGNWYTGNYAYDPAGVLLSQTGIVKGFGAEIGMRFYIHE